jgi:hypothetical protein
MVPAPAASWARATLLNEIKTETEENKMAIMVRFIGNPLSNFDA